MIAVLKRPGLKGWKRTQRFNRARRDHAFVLSSSCNERPRDLSMASRKLCKSLVAVYIDSLAYAVSGVLPLKGGIHPYAAESVLITKASRWIAAGSTYYFRT